MAGSSWIFFTLVMVSSRLEPAGNSCPGGAGCPVGCPGCRMRLRRGHLGVPCAVEGHLSLKVAGEGMMLSHRGNSSAGMLGTQLCPGRGAGELLEVSCPHLRLNSNISGAVGYLGVSLLNQDLKTGIFPKFKRYFKFLNARKRNRSSGAEASGTTCHSHFASPWI